MSYYNSGKQIKDAVQNKTVAIATYEVGAEIIVEALNHYFGDTYTRNDAVEMMHLNTADALKRISGLAKRQEMNADELIDYLIDIADEMDAQALVVSMRDELKFDKPND